MTDHIPVLTPVVIRKLALSSDDVFLDGTVGAGGHARAACARLQDGSIVGIDQDRDAIERAREALTQADCQADVCLRADNFRNADTVIAECGHSQVDAALLDLGFRSEQLENQRGFSFQQDEPLLMTYKHPNDLTDEDLTAQEIVQNWDRDSIEQILDGYANESYSEQIADAIVAARKHQGITTTQDLVSVIRSAVPAGYQQGQRHPATRTFQALRMAVNDEVRSLEAGLETISSLLAPGGRFVVISFQSVEDRITKQFFNQQEAVGAGRHQTDNPIRPGDAETGFNPRSRSAKLRCFQKST
jgi:16S rRNA (cytosine1402-N4)-methyltransferase